MSEDQYNSFPDQSTGRKPATKYDPFGGIQARLKRMEEFTKNPTFKPDEKYGNVQKSKHQKNRFEKFQKKKNAETVQQLDASINARFAGYFTDFNTSMANNVQTVIQSSDVAVPVSTRAIGFETARVYSDVQDDDEVKKHLSEEMNVFKLYRVMLACVERRLRENFEKVLTLTISELKAYSKEEEDYLVSTKSINYFPVGIAVVSSLLDSYVYHDVRYVPVRLANDKVLPEQVFFTNLHNTVTKLSRRSIPAFRLRNPLPAAEWRPDGRLNNPNDFWPADYNLETFRNEVVEVREWLSTVNSYSTKYVRGAAADVHSSGMLMSSSSGAASLHELRLMGDVSDWYSPIPQKVSDSMFGVLSLLGEVPAQAGSAWGLRQKQLASRKGNYSYRRCVSLI